MNKILTGMVAGLAATQVLSLLMIMKGMMGLMPDMNVIAMLAKQMGGGAAMGWCSTSLAGW